MAAFTPAEINYWIETQLPTYTSEQLQALETGTNKGQAENQALVTALLSQATMAVPLTATTKASVLKQLVKLAEQSWEVYDADALLEAIKQREELGSTAFTLGVAIPHPRRPSPSMLGEPVIAFARTHSPIPFHGARDGAASAISFFLSVFRARINERI